MRYRLLYPKGQAMVDYVMEKPLSDYTYETMYEDIVQGAPQGHSLVETCEEVWAKHNRDDRPNGRTQRSMCIGDIVILESWGMWVAERTGFRSLTLAEQARIKVIVPLSRVAL